MDLDKVDEAFTGQPKNLTTMVAGPDPDGRVALG
jgi:hypothetical protein